MKSEVRVDKWLWAMRVFKTRTIATDACKKGRVSIGGTSVKPSRTIKVGDVIDVMRNIIHGSCGKIGSDSLGLKRIIAASGTDGQTAAVCLIGYTKTHLVAGLCQRTQHHVSARRIGRIHKYGHCREQ